MTATALKAQDAIAGLVRVRPAGSDPLPAPQEIEIAALWRLQHALAEELVVAACSGVRPCGSDPIFPPRQLLLVDQQVEPPLLDAQANAVAVAHQCQRPADRRLGSH